MKTKMKICPSFQFFRRDCCLELAPIPFFLPSNSSFIIMLNKTADLLICWMRIATLGAIASPSGNAAATSRSTTTTIHAAAATTHDTSIAIGPNTQAFKSVANTKQIQSITSDCMPCILPQINKKQTQSRSNYQLWPKAVETPNPTK
ncbi:unnamed protein product [Cuscuta epithymum]|uniref:Uncharacterized protein n=1 Tax=Cuscuta epithymum TaxID=186058 RepID=A0AAV0FTU9_9ASTE|nr:unnamed protein product [Cuscuta epithymum]